MQVACLVSVEGGVEEVGGVVRSRDGVGFDGRGGAGGC